MFVLCPLTVLFVIQFFPYLIILCPSHAAAYKTRTKRACQLGGILSRRYATIKPVRGRLGQILCAKSHQNRIENRMCKRALRDHFNPENIFSSGVEFVSQCAY